MKSKKRRALLRSARGASKTKLLKLFIGAWITRDVGRPKHSQSFCALWQSDDFRQSIAPRRTDNFARMAERERRDADFVKTWDTRNKESTHDVCPQRWAYARSLSRTLDDDFRAAALRGGASSVDCTSVAMMASRCKNLISRNAREYFCAFAVTRVGRERARYVSRNGQSGQTRQVVSEHLG